ncbi:MAG: SUMF1/EgtB/PvdO family nonheme iron enzyme [Lentisphaeria bacterium]|nr:SUMF1/EgtB/PvdO family nonheme iron enzyme [Lentisphaeria bacterium]
MRVGLFVGIDRYQNGITPLQCAVSDASALTVAFARAQFDRVEQLLNEDADDNTILDTVENLVNDLGPGDLFVFYFSGHGREFQDTHYLVGSTGRAAGRNYQRGSVSISELTEVSDKPGLNRLFILDCCRSNILAGRDGAYVCDNARDIALNRAVVQNKNHDIIPPLILNSCSSGEQAFENLQTNHGYFTDSLLRVIGDQRVNNFERFQRNLTIDGTPRPQNISWNGNISRWNNVQLFEHWGNDPGPGPGPDPDDIAKYELMIYKPEVEDLLKKCGKKCPSEIFRTYQTAVKAEEDKKYTVAVRFLKMAKEKLEKLINDPPVPEKFSGKVNLPGGHILEMVQIEPGTFIMGSPVNERGRYVSEKQHQVTLTKRFYLGKYPVTQKEYQAVMGNNPSNFKGDNLPVEQVSWDDAKSFCSKLNDLKHNELPAGYRFDLPTEAQWEYACRAGTTTALNNGLNLTSVDSRYSNLDEVAWYDKNSDEKTHPVGQKKQNAWGLYDMHGNVWEWCLDASGSSRVTRGGGWFSIARRCRSAFRYCYDPTCRNYFVGFRVALVPVD